MKKRTKNSIVFYFKTESVIMNYNGSFYIFHTWNDMRNKNNLSRFAAKIINSKDLELAKVLQWCREHNLKYEGTTSSVINEYNLEKRRT